MTDLLHTDKFEIQDHQDPISGDDISQDCISTLYYNQMPCVYIVGAKYIEAPQLKLSELVPYRKYPANTVSRVSKLFFSRWSIPDLQNFFYKFCDGPNLSLFHFYSEFKLR